MKKIMITGASGFLGKYVTEQFAMSGQYEVYAITSGRRSVEFPKGVIVKNADLLNEKETGDLIEEIQPDIMCHLAWALEDHKFLNSEKNIDWMAASIYMLRHFIKNKGSQVLFAGSSSEYGIGSLGYCETVRGREYSLYGITKYTFEQFAKTYCESSGVTFVCARYFSIYGPNDLREGRAIPTAIQTLMKGKKFICRVPYNIWDFVYVEDCAKATFQLVEQKCTGCYNVASGKPQMMKDVFRLISEILQCVDLVEYNLDSTQGVSLTADSTRLKEAVGDVCNTPLRDGLEKTIAWWKKEMNRN